MKNILLFVICFSLFSFKREHEKEYIVKAEIKYIAPYCGGAAPTEEMIQKIKAPRPLPNKKLYIKKGKVNDISSVVVDSVVTDSSGFFIYFLPNGEYLVIDEDKKDKRKYDLLLKRYSKQSQSNTSIDKNCLDKWFRTPDFTFTVNSHNQEIQHTYTGKCSWNSTPCTLYTGPLPPVMNRGH